MSISLFQEFFKSLSESLAVLVFEPQHTEPAYPARLRHFRLAFDLVVGIVRLVIINYNERTVFIVFIPKLIHNIGSVFLHKIAAHLSAA